MTVLRAIFGSLFALAIFLLAGAAAYRAYFAAPEIPKGASTGSRHPALARRALLFVIDGFAPGHHLDEAVMPTFARLARTGAHGIAKTSSMSLTSPSVFSLGTGRPGSLLLGILDFHAPPARVESLPRAMAASGRRVALAGDVSWQRQYGWLARPEDQYATPEPGVTVDPRVRRSDREAVEFLLPRLVDPAYGLLVVHLGSADAAGHEVTPSGPEYTDALRFLDGLLAEAMRNVDGETVVLVTGDHGRGPRGTHGGRDDEATLTPYVFYGPGVRAGASADVPQTALVTTLGAILGLPFPATAEYPPRTELVAVTADAAAALALEFLERKRAAALTLAPNLTFDPRADVAATNRRLNEVLFASSDSRRGLRIAVAAIVMVGLMASLVVAWRSIPEGFPRPPLAGHLVGALAVPAAMAAIAMLVMAGRSRLPFKPWILAVGLAATVAVVAGLVAAAVYRSPFLRQRLVAWQSTVYFAGLVVLSAPLVTCGWTSPQRYFEFLALALALGMLATTGGSRTPGLASTGAWLPVALVSAVSSGQALTAGLPAEWTYLAPLSAIVLGFALRGVGNLPGRQRTVASTLLVASFAAMWVWRTSASTVVATVVLAALGLGVITVWWIRREPVAAGALLVGVASAVALMMASDGREAFVFLTAALGALVLTRRRLPLARPPELYLAAIAAVIVRLVLYFDLGDQYRLTSIRTAPGFRLVDFGLPLSLVISVLLLKYTLPWLLILGGALPSLAAAGRRVTRHAFDVLSLGYVARFAVIAAVVDSLRVLPHGMEGIVGLFAISWAEFATFAVAGVVALAMVPRDAEPATAAAVPEALVTDSDMDRLSA